MERYVIEIASANLEQRPGRSIDPPNDDNWEVIASGQTAELALTNLLEACNDEVVNLDNNWLRLKTKGDDSTIIVKEQCPDFTPMEVKVNIMTEHGKLWIQPTGYGDKTSADGQGWPIGLEIWEGRLRLIVFGNINMEEPQIIDMENAREATRILC